MIGTALAASEGSPFRGDLFALTLFGTLSAHSAAAFANEYFDYVLGADRHVSHTNPFAGGSRVILVRDGLSPRSLLWAAALFSGFGTVVGLILTALRGVPVLAFGLLGYLLLFQYTVPPLKLAYRGWGELAVGVSFGPLVVVGTDYVQSGILSSHALALSIPLGLLVALVLLFNEFPDYDGDVAVNKRNLVVRLGRNRAFYLCSALVFALGLSLLLLVLAMPGIGFVPLGVLPPCVAALFILSRSRDSPDALAPANALMLINVAVLGILLSWSLIG